MIPTLENAGFNKLTLWPLPGTPSSIANWRITLRASTSPYWIFSPAAVLIVVYLFNLSNGLLPSDPVWPIKPDGPVSLTWSEVAFARFSSKTRDLTGYVVLN